LPLIPAFLAYLGTSITEEKSTVSKEEKNGK
jgi:hypothetical protein